MNGILVQISPWRLGCLSRGEADKLVKWVDQRLNMRS
jgi:hypothetical protein